MKNGCDKPTLWEKSDMQKLEAFAADYRHFISVCKTERECVSFMEDILQKAGAIRMEDAIAKGLRPAPGDLLYTDMMKKSLLVFRVGRRPAVDGVRLLGAHIDSPRLDLKPRTLYEDTELAMMDTHYYGGLKKYLWVTLPLAMHGVIVKKDGTTARVVIGEDPDDPVLGISDLLIHLSHKQMAKSVGDPIEGENLNILVGSIPLADTEKDAVKANVLRILSEKYGVDEEDFLSAEIEVVPAGPAREYGLDRSMIMGYGQDDRVCAYPSFRAVMDTPDPEFTSICMLTDKEEIGSVGATSMQSRFFENMLAEYLELTGCYSELALRRVMMQTKVLSSDVDAAFDPNYPEVMDKNNSAYLGKGGCFCKYTGKGGKGGSNDANAEYIAFLRKLLDDEDITFQFSELGRVDVGGGGTIAFILANLGMQVIDFGIPVLSMHAPWEITSKADIYEGYRAYCAFVK